MQNDNKHIERSSKTLPVIAIVFGALALIAWLTFRDNGPCISVPEIREKKDRKAAIDFVLKVEELKIDSNLESSFSQLSEKTFVELSDSHIAFLLLIRGIECLIKAADTPEKVDLVREITPELIRTARSMWSAEQGLLGADEEFSPKERSILEGSRVGTQITQEYAALIRKNHSN